MRSGEDRENDKQMSCGKRDRIRLGNRVKNNRHRRGRDKRRSQRERVVWPLDEESRGGESR